ncbi:MAG: PAS domain S-box protein [Alphaproteobacteria bacterium]|nr:PAS domain S-box protein [Alphaproteobacteria bacterium]|tara:strand:- start:3214 stop:6408 length:3195 start_codon:yes stop_codon:yes gene_type:complete
MFAVQRLFSRFHQTVAIIPKPIYSVLKCLSVATMVFVLAYTAIRYTNGDGRIAAIWPVNAVLIVIALRHRRSEWARLLLAMTVGLVAANTIIGDHVPRAIILSLANVVEVFIVSAAMKYRKRIKLISLMGIVTLVIATLAACAVSASLATIGLYVSSHLVSGGDALLWFAADFLGIVLFVPVLWSLADSSVKLVTGTAPMRTFIEYIIVCGTTLFVFAQTKYPFLFLVPPVLVLLSFSGGVKGAAGGLLAVTAISIPFTFAGSGPTGLMSADLPTRILTLQIFLAANSVLALSVGAAAADRRRIFLQMQRSRERLRAKNMQQKEMISKAQLAERMAGLGHWALDAQTQEVFWSPEVYAIHGVTDEEFNPSYDDAVSFYIPSDREMVSEMVARGIEKAEGWEFHATLKRRSDGALRQVHSIADCITNERGEVARVIGVFRDVTDEQKLLQALSESEAQYRVLADHSTDIIVRFGMDGLITYASPSCKILGVTPEQAVGMRTIDFAIPEDRNYAKDITDELFVKGEPDITTRREIRVRNAEGQIIWLEGSPQVIMGKNGKPEAVISTFRDVTDRKEREEALAEARIEAEKAGHAKTEFLSHMSHEIRTPLNGVLGFAQLLSQTNLDEEQRRYLDKTVSAGRMLREIVNDILDFSKISAGKLVLDETSVNLKSLVGEVVGIVDAARTDKTATISCDVPDLGIKSDEVRLKQILTNLVGNAAKFTQEGSIRVEASRKGDQLVIEVTDTGEGIAAKQLESVFESFQQADNSITRRFGGTGLGLSISRSLARQLGGDLVLESELGIGTTARVTLPYIPAKDDELAPELAEASDQKASLKILAVDDVELNLELLEFGMTRAGHEIVTCSSAEQALELLRNGSDFDLVLMDIQMPNMDGVTATRMIRVLPKPICHVPVIALSANVLPEDVKTYLDAGMTAHFPKPVDLEELDGFIRKTLKKHTACTPVIATEEPEKDPYAELTHRYKVYLSGVAMEFVQIMSHHDREETLQSVYRIAHSIAGAAGSFGFDEVSEAAFALEAAAKKLIGTGQYSEEFISELKNFMQTTEKAAA